MNVRRSVIGAVLAWLAVVAVGSTVVWAVISRAGDGIAPTADPGVVATSPGSGPTAPSASGTPSPGSSSGSPIGPASVRRTWQGAGGLVIADCRGPAISLVSSSADAGFRVEVKDRGPEKLELAFEGQGDEGRETVLKGHCESGVPVFEVDTTGDD